MAKHMNVCRAYATLTKLTLSTKHRPPSSSTAPFPLTLVSRTWVSAHCSIYVPPRSNCNYVDHLPSPFTSLIGNKSIFLVVVVVGKTTVKRSTPLNMPYLRFQRRKQRRRRRRPRQRRPLRDFSHPCRYRQHSAHNTWQANRQASKASKQAGQPPNTTEHDRSLLSSHPPSSDGVSHCFPPSPLVGFPSHPSDGAPPPLI